MSDQSERQPQPLSWTLQLALDVRRRDVVSFVGGGGKTTAMFHLADALVTDGWRAISTTTTHLGREETARAPRHLWSASPSTQTEQLLAELSRVGHLLVTGPPVEDGRRWGGVSPEWVDEVAQLPQVDAVLVEADGARGKPLKAPAEHEPVVPASTTLLVPIVGVDSVGCPLADAAHRPTRVMALTGLGAHEAVTPGAAAMTLGHPAGGLKGLPVGARARAVVNKVHTDAELRAARDIASRVLGVGSAEISAEAQSISAIVICALGTDDPVREVRRRVAAVVLAAGTSSRMETDLPKQLLPWGDSTVIRRVVDTLTGCALSSVLVVTGYMADQVRHELSGTSARLVLNPDYAAGEMLSSLHAGISVLGDQIEACLVVLADQPWLTKDLVEVLLDAYAAGPAAIVAPEFRGQRGHPVLIGRSHWPELLALEKGLAPRNLLMRHTQDTLLVPAATDRVLQDMDTLAEYCRAVTLLDQAPN